MSVQKKRPCQFCVRPGRTRAWWDNFLNGVVLPEEWKGNFRMCKENFVKLCNELRCHIQKKTTTMWSAVDVETQVALTLYYLADEGRLRRTACVFGPIISTVSIIIRRVARVDSTSTCRIQVHATSSTSWASGRKRVWILLSLFCASVLWSNWLHPYWYQTTET